MKQKNCPNCGAPYDINATQCPYCGTSYFDLSFIDFEATEPFYIMIKKRFGNHLGLITMRVMPEMFETNLSTETTDYYGGRFHAKLFSMINHYSASINLGFKGVPREDGRIMEVKVQDESIQSRN